MNRRYVVIGTAAAALAVFAAAGAYYGQFAYEPPAVAGPAGDSVLIRPHSPVIGPADAPVTIVEFFDPSCEACRAFYPYVKQILGEHPKDVRLVLRYAALHEGSDQVVRIIEAARLQDKFQPVLEILLGEQPAWALHGAPDLNKAWELAGSAGLDVERARKDAVSPAIEAVLAQDMADLKAVDIDGTPTFYVNGKPLQSFGPEQLAQLVASEVAAMKAASGS